jgi:hypothetical protein
MATRKKRINVTIPHRFFVFLEGVAKRDDVSLAKKALEWMEEGAELEEDVYFSRLAEERDTPDAKFVSHEEAWK